MAKSHQYNIKAAVLSSLNKPLEIKELISEPLQSGQVLVKVLFSGVCRSQLMEIQGKRGEDKTQRLLDGSDERTNISVRSDE